MGKLSEDIIKVNYMKKLTLLSLSGLILAGCSSLENFTQESNYEKANPQTEIEQRAMSQPVSKEFATTYRGRLLNKQNSAAFSFNSGAQTVNFYVKGMMQDLVANLQFVNGQTPIAVTSFVYLDGSYEDSDVFGLQLSESFIYEIHKFGIPVIDHKVADYVRVSPNGDFVLSRDFMDLNGELPIKYVLTGTLTKHQGGYLVNSRIVGINSKAVVASAQGFVPSRVVKAVQASDQNDGISISGNLGM
jgi:TolB-like protein